MEGKSAYPICSPTARPVRFRCFEPVILDGHLVLTWNENSEQGTIILKVPDLPDTVGAATESNCIGAITPGGEQLEVNHQSVTVSVRFGSFSLSACRQDAGAPNVLRGTGLQSRPIPSGRRSGPPPRPAVSTERLGRRGKRYELASQRGETNLGRADRIIRDGLGQLGWGEEDLRRECKEHPQKVSVGRRLRRETPMTRSRIADRLHIGSGSHISQLVRKQDRGGAWRPG